MTKPPSRRLPMLAMLPILIGGLALDGGPTLARPKADGALFGQPVIRTLTLPADMRPQSATYTPSGRILLTYARPGESDPRQINLAIMDDDGSHIRPVFSGTIPARPKDNGIRYMVFADNKRIFLGDFVIECPTSLDDCPQAQLVPVTYPPQVADGDHIWHRWSEMVVAPDNRHIAWTTLLANYSAAVLTGELTRGPDGYVVTRPQIISSSDPFRPDPAHADGVIPSPIRGGEVKQFVHGGSALSLVGAVKRDLPDSVVMDLAGGKVTPITDTPGYTETTIFSPDERLGMVMTTRFSQTDPAILGLMPRPYPDSLNMGLSMFAYTYAVTGVRTARPGNVGPALIDIARSQRENGYQGANLSSQADWVFHSPMSWHPDSRRATWIEGLRGSETKRVQIVTLPGYKAGPAVAPRAVPDHLPYGEADLSTLPALAGKSQNIDVKVYGRRSGHILYRRTSGAIEKIYVDFSDDEKQVYSGRETTQINMRGQSSYEADIRLTGPKPGIMKLQMTFGPLGGPKPAAIDFTPQADGQPRSRGFAEYDGQRLSVDRLAP